MKHIDSFIKKHKISTTVFGIIVVLLSWWTVVNFMPHPLGDKMEYLGKEDYGNVFGFDSYPYSVYYYGTDMSEEEIAQYLSADLRRPIEDKGAYTDVDLTKNGEDFYLTYESSSKFTTSKKYVVSATNEQYSIIMKYFKK